MQTEDRAERTERTPYIIPDHLKPLRDKHGPCSGCDKLPPEGKTFQACSGCKAVLYCSKECQKAHWAEHRDDCKEAQFLAQPEIIQWLANSCAGHDRARCEDPSWPASLNKTARAVVMNEFRELHRTTFGITLALLRYALRKHGKDLESDKHKLVFWFGYRKESDGNPATRLFVKRVELLEFGAGGVGELGEVAGKLAVDFRGGGVHKSMCMLLDPAIPEDDAMCEGSPMSWIEHLRFATTTGLIMEEEGDDMAGWAMRKKGKKWERTKLVGQEIPQVWQRYYRDKGPAPEVAMGSFTGFLKES